MCHQLGTLPRVLVCRRFYRRYVEPRVRGGNLVNRWGCLEFTYRLPLYPGSLLPPIAGVPPRFPHPALLRPSLPFSPRVASRHWVSSVHPRPWVPRRPPSRSPPRPSLTGCSVASSSGLPRRPPSRGQTWPSFPDSPTWLPVLGSTLPPRPELPRVAPRVVLPRGAGTGLPRQPPARSPPRGSPSRAPPFPSLSASPVGPRAGLYSVVPRPGIPRAPPRAAPCPPVPASSVPSPRSPAGLLPRSACPPAPSPHPCPPGGRTGRWWSHGGDFTPNVFTHGLLQSSPQCPGYK